MLPGIILVVLGILGRVFASTTHITDSTAKAMGWTILNKIVGIVSWLLLLFGGYSIVSRLFLYGN